MKLKKLFLALGSKLLLNSKYINYRSKVTVIRKQSSKEKVYKSIVSKYINRFFKGIK